MAITAGSLGLPLTRAHSPGTIARAGPTTTTRATRRCKVGPRLRILRDEVPLQSRLHGSRHGCTPPPPPPPAPRPSHYQFRGASTPTTPRLPPLRLRVYTTARSCRRSLWTDRCATRRRPRRRSSRVGGEDTEPRRYWRRSRVATSLEDSRLALWTLHDRAP